MMKRTEIRETLFKLLFRAEFNDAAEMQEQVRMFFDVDMEVDADELENEFAEVGEADREYIVKREEDILAHLPEIDKEISEKTTGWTIDRFGKVDLAIVRLAVYEILFDDSIPTGVAINEAVELAKKYGRDESKSFVNGVLSKFAK